MAVNGATRILLLSYLFRESLLGGFHNFGHCIDFQPVVNHSLSRLSLLLVPINVLPGLKCSCHYKGASDWWQG